MREWLYVVGFPPLSPERITMNIDYASDANLAQIVELRRRAFLRLAPQFYGAIEVRNLLADYDTDQLRNMVAGRRLFCCRRNGDLCGTSGWHENRLRHLYVEPDCFGQGNGSALLEHAVADFQARTVQLAIWAGVIIYARGFYEKCGFQMVSVERASDGSEFYLMRTEIGRSASPIDG